MLNTLHITVETDILIRILLLGFLSFLISMIVTPLYTNAAYAWQWWKKPRTDSVTGEKAKVFAKLHHAKHKRLIPTMAGAIFVLSVSIVTLLFNLDRSETWLPLAAFAGAAAVGLIDDVINLKGTGSGKAGLPPRLKLLLTSLVALVGGLFFFSKLDVTSIHVPAMHSQLEIGWLIVPLFVLVVVATANAVNISDGLDGLAGGLASTAFGTYAIIAALEGRFGVAGFCMAIVGALLSYTWFNVYPARFFMGDVGSFALGTALGVVAMLTDTVLLLPIIGLVFVAEAGSVILQVASKKLRHGKKYLKFRPYTITLRPAAGPKPRLLCAFGLLGR